MTHYFSKVRSLRSKVWTFKGEMPIRQKGNGRSIMISDFLLSAIGRLKSPNIDVREIFFSGKNGDGWWTHEHLAIQLRDKAIPAFKELFPNAIGVFVFDNSTAHGAMAKDALVASKMNTGPGGKNVEPMRDGWYTRNGQRVVQPMQDEQGTPKGMKAVLEERGLLCARADGKKWKGLCGKSCCETISANPDSAVTDCCMRRVLSLQPDFLEQTSLMQVPTTLFALPL